MISLQNYIQVSNDGDGHVHLFDHNKPIPEKPSSLCVGFMDIDFDHKNSVVESYDNYIKNHWNKDKEILLATGFTIEDIKSIREKHTNVIKGFGELKCYDTYLGKKVPYKKISFAKQVARYSYEIGCLPVYIHWSLTNNKDVENLENLLSTYNKVPIVLCHMGMCMKEEFHDFAYTEAVRLQNKYNNLWIDISWDAAEYLSNNLMLLSNISRDRIILGSDLNNKSFAGKDIHAIRNKKWGIGKMATIKNYLQLNNSQNIKKLFGIQ